jgi:hypothetical protein
VRRHDVAFYSQPSFILDDFARFAEIALNDGKAVIGLTVVARRDDLYRQLQDRLDIDLAVRQGRYTWLDAEAVIAETLLDGWPDEARFWKTATSLVIQAARRSRRDPPRVALFGEGCGELLRAGKPEAAIRLEQFWEELSVSFNLDVLCTYPISPPRADEDSETFQRLCAAHTSVITR